jgi:hypothetical protein
MITIHQETLDIITRTITEFFLLYIGFSCLRVFVYSGDKSKEGPSDYTLFFMALGGTIAIELAHWWVRNNVQVV